jgi:hypothetical protein
VNTFETPTGACAPAVPVGQSEVGPEVAGSGPTSRTSGSAVAGEGPAGPGTLGAVAT